MPFVCAATFRVKKKHLEEFNERVRKHANNCVTKERGCVSFEVSTDEKDPSRFMLYEVYVTKKDFDRHCKAAHVVRHLKATNPWLDGKVQMVGFMNRLTAPNK